MKRKHEAKPVVVESIYDPTVGNREQRRRRNRCLGKSKNVFGFGINSSFLLLKYYGAAKK